VKIRTEKKSLEKRAILGKNLKEPPITELTGCLFSVFYLDGNMVLYVL